MARRSIGCATKTVNSSPIKLLRLPLTTPDDWYSALQSSEEMTVKLENVMEAPIQWGLSSRKAREAGGEVFWAKLG